MLPLAVLSQQHTVADPVSSRLFHEKVTLYFPAFQHTVFYEMPKNGPLTGQLQGKMVYQGSVKNHRLHGDWQSWYNNGRLLDSGHMQQGVPDGIWKYWDSTGNLLAVRHYDASKLQRVKEAMRLQHPKQTTYPLVRLYRKNKQAALQQLLPAFAFTSHQSGSVSRSFHQLTSDNSTGELGYHPVFNECLHHGLFLNYYSNGAIKDSGYHKNGLKHGIWLHRLSQDGTFYTGAYNNGIPQKEWKEYDAAGMLISIIFFNKSGHEQWRKEFRR